MNITPLEVLLWGKEQELGLEQYVRWRRLWQHFNLDQATAVWWYNDDEPMPLRLQYWTISTVNKSKVWKSCDENMSQMDSNPCQSIQLPIS